MATVQASATLTGVGALITPAPTANMLGNTSFEWDSNSDGLADGWYIGAGAPTCTLSTSSPGAGTHLQQVSVAAAATGDIRFKVPGIVAGATHTLSVDLRVDSLSSGAQAVYKIEWHAVDDSLTGYDYNTVTTTGTLTTRTLTSTAPSGTTYGLVILSVELGGQVAADRIQLIRCPVAMPYVEPECDWIMRAQFVTGDPTGTPGAIGFYIDKVSIRPYEASYAAIGLAAAGRRFGIQKFTDAAWAWVDWYVAHQESDGTMYDYNIVTGTLTKLSTRDSTDSYAGMFLLALRAAYTVSSRSLSGYTSAISKALDAIVLTQDTDGLTWALPTYHAKYLEDQVETASGAFAARDLATAAGNSTLATRASTIGNAMLTGMDSVMWNATLGSYDWAISNVGVHTNTNWANYPDGLQQMWAVIFGLPSTTRAAGLVSTFLTNQPNWFTYVGSGNRFDSIVSAALRGVGLTTAADAGWRSVEGVGEARARAYDFTPAKAGWVAVAQYGAEDLYYDLPTASSSATLAGIGSLTATATNKTLSSATLAGAGSLSAVYLSTIQASATLTGVGALTFPMMFSVTARNTAVTAVKITASYISLHSADPGATGANEIAGGAYVRVQTTWGTVANGAATGSAVVITVPAATAITYWGLWTASSGGTLYYGGLLGTPESYGVSGTYTVVPTLTAAG